MGGRTCGVSIAQVVHGGQLGQARDLALQAEPREVAAVRRRIAAALRAAMAAGLLRAGIVTGRPRKRAQLRRQCRDLAVLARDVPLQLHCARLCFSTTPSAVDHHMIAIYTCGHLQSEPPSDGSADPWKDIDHAASKGIEIALLQWCPAWNAVNKCVPGHMRSYTPAAQCCSARRLADHPALPPVLEQVLVRLTYLLIVYSTEVPGFQDQYLPGV